jgi:muramidase (phage lysozyme)
MNILLPAVVVGAGALFFARQANASVGDAPSLDTTPPDAPAAPAADVQADAPAAPAADVQADAPAEYQPDQLPTFFQELTVAATPSTYAAANVATGLAETNVKAFLDMLAYSEGTSGPDGYRTLFGGGLFDDFADHPRRAFQFKNKLGQRLWTTAAGRYQFMAISPIPGTSQFTKSNTWDTLKAKLSLPDFSPESQDLAALELVRQRGALTDVQAGRFNAAVTKCAPIWASLPGAGYAQTERKFSTLVAAFQSAGGQLEA